MNSPGSPCTAKVGFQKTSLFCNDRESFRLVYTQQHRSALRSYLVQTRRGSVDNDDFRFSGKDFTVAKAKVTHRACNGQRVRLSIGAQPQRDSHRGAGQRLPLSTLLFDNAETGWHCFCQANLAPCHQESTEYPSTRANSVQRPVSLPSTNVPPELRLHHVSTSAVEYSDFPVDTRDFERSQLDEQLVRLARRGHIIKQSQRSIHPTGRIRCVRDARRYR